MFEEYMEKKKKEWYLHISRKVLDLSKRKEKLTYNEWQNLTLNSYEREELLPNVDDFALVQIIGHCIDNCTKEHKRPCITYDHALKEVYAPMLLERFKLTIVTKCKSFKE